MIISNNIKIAPIGRLFLGILFVVSIYLYISAPDIYNHSFCVNCFIVFIMSAGILLSNNIKKYKTMVLFETLFVITFFFTNYVYPIFLYFDNPYFSLFAFSFSENIISKSTALATVGICSYSFAQYETRDDVTDLPLTKPSISKVSAIEVVLLFILLLLYTYKALPALIDGSSYSKGAGLFRVFAIFLCFKRIYNHDISHPLIRDIAFWSIIAVYIIINLLVGNRGDPLFVIMAIFISYELFIHHISYKIFIPFVILGLAIFFVIGEARGGDSGSMLQKVAQVEKVSTDDTGGILMYGEQLIINNRSLYVLVDYADKNGLNFGQTWQMYLYSIIPFLQSFMIKFFDIPLESYASIFLTTYLEFGKDSPDAFGLGTNLIGDIYLCFGLIGVVIGMYLLGYIVRYNYILSKNSTTSSIIYICLFTISVYYTRASLFEPSQLIIWSLILYKLTFKNNKLL